MAEKDFSSCVTASNAASDSYEFKWTVKNYFSSYLSDGACQDFFSKLSGGIKFQIIIYKCGTESHYNQNPRFKVKVVMKENTKNCVIKTFLYFDIRNNSGQLYLKDSIVKRFSQLNEEHESDGFEMPSRNHPVYCQQRNIHSQALRNGLQYWQDRAAYGMEMYFDQKFVIHGSVIFQCCEEKNVPEPLCKNISQLQSDLKGLLHKKFYADVKFLIGDDVMHAHKTILCSRSEVFSKMFQQNMKEKEGSTVKITDIEKPVFGAFLHFLYTGTILDNKLGIVMPLYSVADKYAVDTLLTTCSNLLVSYISDKTVALILKLADMHNDATLKVTAIDFICKNFAKVEITDSWDTLLNSDPRLASYVLKRVSVRAAESVSEIRGVDENKTKKLSKNKKYTSITPIGMHLGGQRYHMSSSDYYFGEDNDEDPI